MYTLEHEGTRFSPYGKVPSDYPNNLAIENTELEHIKTTPKTLFLYVSETPRYGRCEVSTFLGSVVGKGSLGKIYRSNFGDERRSISVRIHGSDYFGTYYFDSGDYARLYLRK